MRIKCKTQAYIRFESEHFLATSLAFLAIAIHMQEPNACSQNNGGELILARNTEDFEPYEHGFMAID